MKSSHEWVIELHQLSINRWNIVGPAWMELTNKPKTWKTRCMRPTTLDKCIEVMVYWCNYHENSNPNLIPVEALGL